MSTGLYSITTRANGTLLTAAIYNADHQNHVTNQNPLETGAYSDNQGQMQVQTSPGAVGTESLAPHLGGELERLRFVIARMAGQSFWYTTPGWKATASAFGINMTPTNVLDITQNANAAAIIGLLNNSNGAAAAAELLLSNGTSTLALDLTGTAYSGALLTGGMSGELAHLFTTGAKALEFGVNSIYAMGLDTSRRLLIGYNADQGGGEKLQVNSGAKINGAMSVGGAIAMGGALSGATTGGFSGAVTASSFIGDGSSLSNIVNASQILIYNEIFGNS